MYREFPYKIPWKGKNLNTKEGANLATLWHWAKLSKASFYLHPRLRWALRRGAGASGLGDTKAAPLSPASELRT